MNAVYVPLEARDVDDFVAFARRARTARREHHRAVQGRDACRTSTRSTRWRSASAPINTLVVRDGRWIGANTDVEGFLAPLRGRMALEGHARDRPRRGGAARAVAVALAPQGAAVTICARRPEAARAVAALVGGTVGSVAAARRQLGRARQRHAGRQRRTPRTTRWTACPLDGEIVFDLVYAPARHALLRTRARARAA